MMMTLAQVVELLETAGEDIMVSVSGDTVRAIVDDFAGFDDDWCEVDRELDDEDRVDAIEDTLEGEALSVSGDYYRYYEFDGFTVVWGYSSMDV